MERAREGGGDATRVVAQQTERAAAPGPAPAKRRFPRIPPRAGRALAIAAPLVVAAIVAAVVNSGWLGGAGERGEPRRLGESPIEASFGVGPGVDFQAPGGKTFEVDLFSPVRTAVVLRMAARDVEPGEVQVIVNGRAAGALPSPRAEGDEVEVVLHPEQLARGFVNDVKLSPARGAAGTWRIERPRVELVPLPEDAPEALASEAAARFARASAAQEHRDLGAQNRALAWREYSSAWLLLESHPPPRPALHADARERMLEAERELERLCARLLLRVEALRAAGDASGARAAVEDGARYFPDDAARKCPALTFADTRSERR